MNNEKTYVLDKNNNPIPCNVITILKHNDNLLMIYKEENNNSLTDNLLASKIISTNNSTYNLAPLNEDEWNFIESRYPEIINKIKSGDIDGL